MDLKEYFNLAKDIEHYSGWLKEIINNYDKIIILGNGGSNSISSHIAQDYTKILEKKALAFTDPSMLTAYINDYGMRYAYSAYLSDFATKKTLVILISSSGESENIINAANYCIDNDIKFCTLSGFNKDNTLNSFDKQIFKYWVDSHNYGIVECIHLLLLHSII